MKNKDILMMGLVLIFSGVILLVSINAAPKQQLIVNNVSNVKLFTMKEAKELPLEVQDKLIIFLPPEEISK